LAASCVAAERDRRAGAEQCADFRDELVLLVDPRLVGGGAKGEDAFAAYAGDGVSRNQGEKRVPLQGRGVEVGDRGGDGVE